MKSVRFTGTRIATAAALLSLCGWARGNEIIVPTQMTLSVALA